MKLNRVYTAIAPASGGKDFFLEIFKEEINHIDNLNLKNFKFSDMVSTLGKKLLFKKLIDEGVILKEQLEAMPSFEKNEIFDEYKNNKRDYILYNNLNLRRFLQTFNENIKKIHSNIHVAYLFFNLLQSNQKNINLITDCRFENELLAIFSYNNSKNREDFIISYLSSVPVYKIKNIRKKLLKILELDFNHSMTEDILCYFEEVLTNIKNYQQNFDFDNFNSIEHTIDIQDLYKMNRNEFLKNGIVVLRRKINFDIEEEINKQKILYKEHNIDFNNIDFQLKDGGHSYLGSADPSHISERLSFSLKDYFINYTNSDFLKKNLLPSFIEIVSEQYPSIKKREEKLTSINFSV